MRVRGGTVKQRPPSPGPPEVALAKVISKRIKDWDEYTGRFQAVGTDHSQSFGLVLGPDKKLADRAIQPGRNVDGLRIIRKGLNPGDVVVSRWSRNPEVSSRNPSNRSPRGTA